MTAETYGVKKGDRIKLLHCDDPYTKLERGTLGTVRHIDSRGTIHVAWDDGSTLGICIDQGDDFELMEQGS